MTCTPNPVPWNTSTTCTATAGAGYGFVSFSWRLQRHETSCTLNNVTSAKSVTANFAQNAITATASPAAGGSVSCDPNPVPYGGNSTCTASAASKYTFTGFSGDCSGATCTLSGVTSNKNVTANFVSNTLAITSSPSSAAVGVPFDVIIGSTPTGADVSFSAGCDASSSKTTLGDGSTKFTITINTLPAPPSTCTMTFTATNYNPIPLNNLQVYKGVLFCGDYDSINGPGIPPYDPDAPSTISGLGSSYVGTPGWGLRRGPNKDGPACVKVNYTCDLDATANTANCTFDKLSGQQATFKYLFLWAPRAPQANGWTSIARRSRGTPRSRIRARAARLGSAVECISDLFPALPTLPTTILPTDPECPAVHGWREYVNGLVPAERQALVCGAQQGWTSVERERPGNASEIQIWNIIIDESDLAIKGP